MHDPLSSVARENMNCVTKVIVLHFRGEKRIIIPFLIHSIVLNLTISNCFVNVKHYRASFSNKSCIDYVAYRARALPIHDPDMISGNGQKSSKKVKQKMTFLQTKTTHNN